MFLLLPKLQFINIILVVYITSFDIVCKNNQKYRSRQIIQAKSFPLFHKTSCFVEKVSEKLSDNRFILFFFVTLQQNIH